MNENKCYQCGWFGCDHCRPKKDAVKRPLERLVMRAESMGDSDEVVYSGELFLLRKVFEAASDYRKSKLWDDFGKRHPPEETQQALFDSVLALEIYFSDFE